MANLSSSNMLSKSGLPSSHLLASQGGVQSNNDPHYLGGLATAEKLQSMSFSDLLKPQQSETDVERLRDSASAPEPFGAPVATDDTNPATGGSDELKQAFQDFVGKTFFSQMIASMRSTQQESAYFNGGQAEKIFQGQLDQILTDEITKASSSQIAEPMYRLFQLQRSK